MNIDLRDRLAGVSEQLHLRSLDLHKPAELDRDMGLVLKALAIQAEALLALAASLDGLAIRRTDR